jgi:hypothetical protein
MTDAKTDEDKGEKDPTLQLQWTYEEKVKASQGRASPRASPQGSASPRASPSPVVMFIDIDGYCATGESHDRVVSDEADGFRAREMAILVMDRSFQYARYNAYFIDDAKTSKPLDEKNDFAVRFCHNHLHGLPVNPAVGDWPTTSAVFLSNQLHDVLRGILEWTVSQLVPGSRLVVAHKGGLEGQYISELGMDDISIVDLATLGCPKIEKIAMAWPFCDYLMCDHCIGSAVHCSRLHCPTLEVYLFGWWALTTLDLVLV